MNIQSLTDDFPILKELTEYDEIFWTNPKKDSSRSIPFSMRDINDAEERLKRFAPLIEKAFPETKSTHGIIESPLLHTPKLKDELETLTGPISGSLYVKLDSHLPVSGSIKARGGIYEVLKFAEKVATDQGLLSINDDYSILLNPEFRKFFSQYSLAVGSTGNLGLSIGIMGATLGFNTTVHMSSDARQWKKDLLRSRGVTVVEYSGDYQTAVAEGRRKAADDKMCHFVDDEGSVDLFLGYSVAAKRLKTQLAEMNIAVNESHPLFVYLPCGVGGGPGGVAFGLKELFGNNVHIFFAEPTHAPCMTLGLITGLNDKICCQDFNIDGKTEADGLAVGRASRLVSQLMEPILDGCFTVSDEKMYLFLSAFHHSEGIDIEPSACAGFPGPSMASSNYVNLSSSEKDRVVPTHILWATGGSMVPADEMKYYLQKGNKIRYER